MGSYIKTEKIVHLFKIILTMKRKKNQNLFKLTLKI